MTAPRTTDQRRAHAVDALHAVHADAWVATASGDAAHLVPLSYAWDGTHVILATEESAVTTRNICASGRARLALGHTRDVVLVEAAFDNIVAVREAPAAIAETYAGQADWDPRHAVGDFVYLRLRPQRIQVWREADEIAGRTVMRAGSWID